MPSTYEMRIRKIPRSTHIYRILRMDKYNVTPRGHFCDGMRRNAIPEVFSQKDASLKLFPGIDITKKRTSSLSDRIFYHYAFRNLSSNKNSTGYISLRVWLRVGRPGDRGSIPRRNENIFPLASVSRPALRPTQPPAQRVPGVVSPGRDADYSPPSSTEVNNG
jgi:hypothetical protein